MRHLVLAYLLGAAACAHAPVPRQATATPGSLPQGFVYLDMLDPSIVVELRYATPHNFVGAPLPGYGGKRAIMTAPAARALVAVQAQVRARGLTLKVYDAYRPEKAVQRLVDWLEDPQDRRMQAEFYPREDKAKFVERSYIAARSSHTRGSAVDVTLVPLPIPQQATYTPGDALLDGSLPKGQRFDDNSIDMGTNFDTFDDLSHMDNPALNTTARGNRALLRQAMEDHGFKSIDSEWWHYAFVDEPFPETYFDFDISDTYVSNRQ